MAKDTGIDIGIGAKDRKAVAKALAKLLADNYTLYLKTHAFHWNVTGPMFNALHAMFMTQYNELWLALDEIAERIRALGEPAPGSGQQYAQLASIPEETGVPDWRGIDAARACIGRRGTRWRESERGGRRGPGDERGARWHRGRSCGGHPSERRQHS